jgi:two-component system sensor histidine kinase KdpD
MLETCYTLWKKAASPHGSIVKASSETVGYLFSLLLVAGATIVCEFIRPYLVPTNMVMVYQLAVVVAAAKLGLRPAIATALIGVVTFDFFFVPPRLTFSVTDKEYLVTFFGFIVIGVIISSLVAKVRKQSEEQARLSREAEQARILQAQDKLERALLNSISHDLRTPLVSITGAISALKDKEGDHLSSHARRELMETAYDEAERLNRFVGNLLDMTRIEAGALRLNIGPCDIQELVGCALSAMETRLADRKVLVDLPVGLTLVPLDMLIMIQVLVNLLDNANKHAADGSEIEIRASVDNDWLSIKVSDRGPGVPEPELSRLFDKFYRIAVPERVGGTGLGLSICKGFVEAHGGTISAKNRDAGGLIIEIKLPMDVRTEDT